VRRQVIAVGPSQIDGIFGHGFQPSFSQVVMTVAYPALVSVVP
jgi:hypothetical protein